MVIIKYVKYVIKNKGKKQCFNWRNLRPCWKLENIKKGNKIIDSIINNQKIKVENFLKINPLPTQPGDRVEGIE